MIPLIGYPDFIQDDAKLDNYHKDLRIGEKDDYFSISSNVELWRARRKFLKFGTLVDRAEFLDNPAVVNAHY